MQKINRLGWAEGTWFSSYGVNIGIRASQCGAIERLVPFLPPRWESIEFPRRLDMLYSWVVGGERNPNMRTFDVLYANAERLARTLRPSQLFEELARDLRMKLAVLSRRFVFIHAGVVGWQGRAILLPARAGGGKSTLVEALVRAGAEYFSDEFAVLDRSGRVHPFAKPISVHRSAPSKGESLSVEAIGGRTAEHPARVGIILVTRYQMGARLRFREVSPGQGVLDLIRNAYAARLAPSQVLRAARNACTGAILLRGLRGEAQQVVEPLLRMLDGWPDLHKNSHVKGDLCGVPEKFAMASQGD